MKKFIIKLLHFYLKNIQHGTLTITLPDQHKLCYGKKITENDLQAEIQVLDYRFILSLILYGDIGFGDAYYQKYWDTPNLEKVFLFLLRNGEFIPDISSKKKSLFPTNLLKSLNIIQYRLGRKNSLLKAKKNIQNHYDLSNDFFKQFLDSTMTYSSAFFISESQSLEEAQKEKYDRICRISNIQKGDHVLEIGGGWGGFGLYASKKYQCKVTSLSLSEKQAEYANQKIQENHLADSVSYLIRDYRDMDGKFDKIISIEMIEAVGIEYLQFFFQKCNELLKPGGTLSLQAILCPDSRFETMKNSVDWLQKHIFPGGALPSLGSLIENIQKNSEYFLFDFKDMGKFYAKTLSCWYKNFTENLSGVSELGFNEEFIRKWQYYLKYCEAAFMTRNITVAQLAFTRVNSPSL